ncbi:MAG TPA: hypothetical protein VGF46_06185 [Gaiellales bacterium]|jgi:hypothetical protein
MSNRIHGALAVLAALVALLALPAAGSARPSVASPGVGINYSTLPGLQTGAVPWAADDGKTLRARLDRLGLPVLGAEQLDYHIHAHLDIYVRGVQIPVPALVGIDVVDEFLTVLHTHDATGIVHIESATNHHYQLGDFFGVWGVRLSGTCIGSYCARQSAKVRVWVNGKPYTKNPAGIVMREHDEIVLSVGTKGDLPNPIPKRYKWQAGL